MTRGRVALDTKAARSKRKHTSPKEDNVHASEVYFHALPLLLEMYTACRKGARKTPGKEGTCSCRLG